MAAGASAGAFKDTKDADNPDGYAEHPEVRAFNDRLLAHLGSSWDNWGFRASTIDLDTPELMSWRNEAARILESAFPGPGPFVLKDPRISTLLPFWERVVTDVGFQLCRIVILRDPAEVAESQRQRVERRLHDFPVIEGSESMAALWAVTMSEVLVALSDDATLLVSHADIISNPEPTLAAAVAFLGIEVDSGRIAEFVASGIKPSLYRSRRGSSASFDGTWMAAARELFDDLARAGTPRLLAAAEARIMIERQEGLAALMPSLFAVRESIARMRTAQAERQSQISALEQFIWALAPLAVMSAKAHEGGAIEQAVAVAESVCLTHMSFATAHVVAQLLVESGRVAEAEQWLERIGLKFGQTEQFIELEQTISAISRKFVASAADIN